MEKQCQQLSYHGYLPVDESRACDATYTLYRHVDHGWNREKPIISLSDHRTWVFSTQLKQDGGTCPLHNVPIDRLQMELGATWNGH